MNDSVGGEGPQGIPPHAPPSVGQWMYPISGRWVVAGVCIGGGQAMTGSRVSRNGRLARQSPAERPCGASTLGPLSAEGVFGSDKDQ